MVAVADGSDQALGADAAKHRDRQLGADAGDGQQLLKQALFVRLLEAEELQRVLADMGVHVQRGRGADIAELGVGGDGDQQLITHTAAIEDDGRGSSEENLAAQMSNHCGDCRGTLGWICDELRDRSGRNWVPLLVFASAKDLLSHG